MRYHVSGHTYVCVSLDGSGIMSALRQECKWSYIMCVSGIMSACPCVLAVSCPHQQECKRSHMCVSGIMSASRQVIHVRQVIHHVCVSGIMSALRQECKRSYIMCVSGIMSASRHM